MITNKKIKLMAIATAGMLVFSSCGGATEATMKVDKPNLDVSTGKTAESLVTMFIDDNQIYDINVLSGDETIATVTVVDSKNEDDTLTKSIVVTGVSEGETDVIVTATVKEDATAKSINNNVVYASGLNRPTADVDGTTNENGQQTRGAIEDGETPTPYGGDEPMLIDEDEPILISENDIVLSETINVTVSNTP